MENDDLMIITKSGLTIRMGVEDISVQGRATQGVRLIRLEDDDEIASVAKVEVEDKEESQMEDTPAIEGASPEGTFR